jgi:NAD(P)H-nitrite reductase large subunit
MAITFTMAPKTINADSEFHAPMAKGNILEKGAILQRDGMYSISPHIAGGFCDPAVLRKIADVAEKYGARMLKLTGSQRIAIIGIREEDIDAARAEFEDGAHAIGPTVRTIKMCPGTRSCKKAIQDAPALGLALDAALYGQPMPAKFKMAVSGCPNCCSDSWMKDVGFFGTKNGFTVTVGGKGGRAPRVGRILAESISPEQAVDIVEKIIAFYRQNGKAHERLGSLIDRIGFEAFAEKIKL